MYVSGELELDASNKMGERSAEQEDLVGHGRRNGGMDNKIGLGVCMCVVIHSLAGCRVGLLGGNQASLRLHPGQLRQAPGGPED